MSENAAAQPSDQASSEPLPEAGSIDFRLLQIFTFMGSFLLFTLEPFIGRLFLPFFGGSFQVWTTCLMVFQILLVLGYFYCHKLAPKIGRWHLAFVGIALISLPIQVRSTPDFEAPVLSLSWNLLLSIGLPFLVLSSTSVIAQQWLTRSRLPEREQPYQLYAASNLGSLIGLFSYPFVVELLLGVKNQGTAWSAGFIGYFVLCIVLFRRLSQQSMEPAQTPENKDSEAAQPGDSVPFSKSVFWFLAAAFPSMLLLAVSNIVTQDTGSFPFFWTIPLGLYTLTFIIVFQPNLNAKIRPEVFYCLEVITAMSVIEVAVSANVVNYSSVLQIFGVGFIFTLSMHRELYLSRPKAEHLSHFYLMLAVGGAAGGTFVTLLAPVFFNNVAEFSLSILLIALLLFVARVANYASDKASNKKQLIFAIVCVLSSLLLAYRMRPRLLEHASKLVYQHRNYYGLHKIHDQPIGKGRTLRMYSHGSTSHGAQVIDKTVKRARATAYYHPNTSVGQLLKQRPQKQDNLAVIGLGTGCLATYCDSNDAMDFYELDSDNERIARKYFDFLNQSEGKIKVIIGDARIRLTEAPDHSYDMLFVDAFSSDSIPTHLLTLEALQLYYQKLKPNGLLFFHISNRFYDLKPTLSRTCSELDKSLYFGRSVKLFNNDFFFKAHWCLVLPKNKTPKDVPGVDVWDQIAVDESLAPWTDDFHAILKVLLRSASKNE